MTRTTRRFVLYSAGAAAGTVAAGVVLGKCLAAGTGTAPQGGLFSLADVLIQVRPPAAAPKLAFTTADGKPRTLADYVGQGVVLNLWATWCAPCVAEMPALNTLAGKLAADHIVVLPVSIDRTGAKAVEPFYKAHDITALPVLLDPAGDAPKAVGVTGIPTTLIIDRKGLVAGKLQGPVDWAAPAAAATIRKLVG